MGLVAGLLALMGLFLALGLNQVKVDNLVPSAPYGLIGIFFTTGLVFVSYTRLLKIAIVAEEIKNPSRIIPLGMNYVRIWDKLAAQRVDYFIANSNLVKSRIRKYYKANANVIYPPVFLENFKPGKNFSREQSLKSAKSGDYYLMIGRLVPYKKFDLGVKVFNKLGLPLKIVGDGPEYDSLKKLNHAIHHTLG